MTSLKSLLSAAILATAPLASAHPRSVTVALDLNQTGAPIEPFIYGQFIEHLGRCIYGGIWAEMLEDRKFYFPITADYAPYAKLTETEYPVVGASPWEITGNPAGVSMSTTAPFVGEHSPVLKSGSGIRQHDLGVRADLDYHGYVWVKTVKSPATVEVALRWADGESDRVEFQIENTDDEFSRFDFSFTPTRTVERGASFSLAVKSGGIVLGPPSLMPADNVKGMRADTIALLKQLNAPVYRWPGGNFVSGYDWRDGIGDRDRRPPRKNPAWTGVEHNDFGTDEFIAFCREIGTAPMIAANTGFGDDYSAAQWVEYTNAGADTIGGAWRIANGHAEAYAVKNWCLGNEMWGRWQLGFMALSQYVLKNNLVADAMWAVDPDLTLVAVGDLDAKYDENDANSTYHQMGWSEGMLRGSGAHMTMLSEHFYSGRLPWDESERLPLIEHVNLLKTAIREKADGHRALQATLPELDGRIIPIAMDEWNYWHRDYQYGELGCIYDLADALGVAIGLHEFFRQSDIIKMAHYAQTVNVIGALKTSRIAAAMEGTGLMLQLYRNHFGTQPITLMDDFGDLDIAAALTDDGKFLTLGVINPTPSPVTINLDARGGLPATADRWHVAGENEYEHNTPGRPAVLAIVKTPDMATDSKLVAPPLSAAVFRFRVD